MSTPLSAAESEILKESCVHAQCLWYTVIHSDPVDTMSYTTWVFHFYSGSSLPVTETRMMRVHTTGRAVTSQGAREHMEVDVAVMHGYGLRAIIGPVGDDTSTGDSSGGR